MVKKRMSYAQVEADLSTRYHLSIKEEDVHPTGDRATSWTSSSYSDYLVPSRRQKVGLEGVRSKNTPREDMGQASSPKPKQHAKLKKRRASVITEEPIQPQFTPPLHITPFPQPSMPAVTARQPGWPLSAPIVGSRPVGTTQTFVTPDSRARSMWLNRRIHLPKEKHQPVEFSQNRPAMPPPIQPSFSGSSTSAQSHTRPRTPASFSTSIDEQEYLDLADYTYPSPTIENFPPSHVFVPAKVSERHSRHLSAATSLSLYSQLSCPHDLQVQPTLTTLSTGGPDPPKGVRMVHRIAIEEDQASIASADTIHAPIPRRSSSNTLAGWVGYDSETQSLHTITDRDTYESDMEFDICLDDSGYYGSQCSTPTAVGLRSSGTSTFGRSTFPRTPSTLVARSRFSALSQDTQATQTSKSKPTSALTPTPKPRAKQGQKITRRQRTVKRKGKGSSRCPSPSPSQALKFNTHAQDLALYSSGSVEHDIHLATSSKNSILLDNTICLDYDYSFAVDVLIYGTNMVRAASHATLRPCIEDVISELEGVSPPTPITRRVSSAKKGSSIRRMWVGKPVTLEKSRKGRAGNVKEKTKQRSSLFSQVSQLFMKT